MSQGKLSQRVSKEPSPGPPPFTEVWEGREQLPWRRGKGSQGRTAFRGRRKDQLQLRGMLLASDRGEDGAGCTGVGHAAVTELMQQWETGKQNPGRSFCREMRCERLETTLRRSFLLRGADRW